MGSNQSQPSRPSSSRSPRQHNRSNPAQSSGSATPTSSTEPSTQSTSRFSSLRRLSAIGRRDSSKRHRGSSVNEGVDGDRKKQRVEGTPLSPRIELPPRPPLSPLATSSSLPAFDRTISESHIAPYPQPDLTQTSTPLSPPGSPDVLLPDRLRSLSTIRDALGPNWSTNTANPTTARERLENLQRRSISSSSPIEENGETERITDRIYSLLNLTPPTRSRSLDPSPLPSPGLVVEEVPTPPEIMGDDSDMALEDLTRRLESARANLADAQRRIEDLEGDVNNEAPDSTSTQDRTSPSTGPGGERRGIPAGAVLIIQGLAQTHAVQNNNTNSRSSSSIGSEDQSAGRMVLDRLSRRIPGLRARSNSEGNVASPNSSSGGIPPAQGSGSGEGVEERPSLEGQARMISGLLTVAATATATSLLAPASQSNPSSRSNPNSRPSLLDRLRRGGRSTAPTVETALGNYLRNALQNRRPDPAPSTPTPRPGLSRNASSSLSTGSNGDSDVSDEFQRFLEGLQTDVLGAVRLFTGSTEEATSINAEVVSSVDNTTVSSDTSAGPPVNDLPVINAQCDSPSVPDSGGSAVDHNSPSTETETAASPSTAPEPTSVPSFHPQLGQILANDPARRFGVSGGSDGQPRRLNLFRAHMFPPIRSVDGSSTNREETGSDDPEGMVPCIFVGVRSLAHDPAMTTDDLVAHPSFPFSDGNVPPTPAREEPSNGGILADNQQNNPLTPVTSAPGVLRRPTTQRASTDASITASRSTSSVNIPSDRRSLTERFLDRIVSRRQEPAEPQGTALNTYLVFVIGGYYPRSHPVLSIPNLITGGPLSDEEMSMISELMGPGKPPTASKEEIEKSGLEVVPASLMTKLGEEGKILENCIERCLVCLGDYEPEEECRVLKCRHAFHQDCVDHWLSSGRNSCPACRSEAVDVKKSAAPVADLDPTGVSANEGNAEGISSDGGLLNELV